MHKRILIVTIVIFIATPYLSAQNGTNSPYTRFGYGELSNNTNGAQSAMGGLSIATRSNRSINASNPASYTSIDSLTFMFDIGGSLFGTTFQENTGRRSHVNGNLEYITLQFPITKYLGFSAGILPYSSVGYSLSQSDSIEQAVNPGVGNTQVRYTKSFSGNGGVTQVYGGVSAELFKRLSLGVNVYYMFGTINHYRQLGLATNYISVTENSSLQVRDVRFRYGLQYYDVIAQKHAFTLGAVYEHKSKLNGSYERIVSTYNDTLLASSKDDFDLPGLIGGGIHYTYDKRISVGVDYHYQMWSDARYYGVTDSLKNRTRLAIGAEYVHNPLGRRYIDRMAFRVGGSISNSYLSMQQSKDYSVTMGIGFPLRSSKSMINTSFEYYKRGSKALLQEDQFKFTLSVNINETWFFKRKL